MATAHRPARRALFEPEHEAFRESFRTFLEREVVAAPPTTGSARASSRARCSPPPGAHGFLGMAVPEELGGAGVDDFRFNVVIGEEAHARRAWPASGSGITLHNDICLPYFLHVLHARAARALAARHRRRASSSPRSR